MGTPPTHSLVSLVPQQVAFALFQKGMAPRCGGTEGTGLVIPKA